MSLDGSTVANICVSPSKYSHDGIYILHFHKNIYMFSLKSVLFWSLEKQHIRTLKFLTASTFSFVTYLLDTTS